VLECTARIIQPFYNRSTVLAGDLVDDALHARSIGTFSGSTSSVEQRSSQRVHSKIGLGRMLIASKAHTN
jgi:hypothetical protein